MKSKLLIASMVMSLTFTNVSQATAVIFAPATITGVAVSQVVLNGLGYSLLGGGLFAAGVKVTEKGHGWLSVPLMAASGLCLLIGLTLLENNDTNPVAFKEITADGANKLGITDSQRDDYNSSVDILNAISENAAIEVSKAKTSDEQLIAARNVWSESSALLSREALEVVKKIVGQNVKN